ncbi:NAD(P)H-dependent oxidoreductase [Novosphingobium resinovorum]|uniref:NADPH-dependent FMN reductase n=1 Tax=Novosphingobium resinovorum TaxID=158500 RepID=UPI002ED3F5A1|nr:NAD(P)H-dependent oxidoreductase [Novosphingobium resinovorum]
MPKLLVVIASTRPGRVGLPVGQWAAEEAAKQGGFEVEIADLAELNLPLLDEPNHPRMAKYTKEHTSKWASLVDSADAFLFVVPEYNYGPPPSLLNAISYLYWEWAYKPAGFVSYGGMGAGLRSVQELKLTLTAVRMMPIADGVAIPFVMKQIQDGKFASTPIIDAALPFHLDEVLRWTKAMEPLRAGVPERRRELPPGAPPPGGPGAPGGPGGPPPVISGAPPQNA